MERPKSILGLASHAARLRWQALSPRHRMLTIGVGALMTGTALFGVKLATGDCCCHGGCETTQATDAPCDYAR